MRVLLASFAVTVTQDLFLAPTSDEDTLAGIVRELERVQGGPQPKIGCMVTHCAKEVLECGLAPKSKDTCMGALTCSLNCSKQDDGVHNQAPGCAYLCEMMYGKTSPVYTKLIECAGETNKCLPIYPDDGECLATDADAVQNLTSLDQLEGDWWVVKGVNCGQQKDGYPFRPGAGYPPLNPTKGKSFPGGYDWYPCQHERFVRSNGHDFPNPTSPWVNNITYCGGANGGLADCNTTIIDTVANVTMCAPGVVCHNYTDAPLKPQFEHWRVISWPHPDYVASIWCGGTPLVTYNGGITLARNKRSLDGMPAWVEENFRAAYAKFGVEWEQMCPSNNEDCP
mmetsp:Transcript_19427/g.46828  ORF Transcript_19427/g.46828 Transcript_19427/m.46828 type:complete len:339 (+) Transcript_19427:55-1071(+)